MNGPRHDNADMQARSDPGDGGTSPPSPGTHLDRPALLAALDTAVASGLAMVAGGPGWGKSTTVAAWASRRNACWITLDHTDASAPRLANRILQAARRRLPNLPAELLIATQPAGTKPAPARVDAIAAGLCGLLASHLSVELVLVLDGLHKLPAGSDAVRLVAALSEQGPAALRLVVIIEPAAAGPAASALWAEAVRIGPDLLAFSPAEVAAFLHAALGVADPAVVDQVYALTSGWPAAVRLAAETLRVGGADGQRATARLQTIGTRVLDELAAGVLAGEPEPARQLLTTVAVLDRFDVPSCEALGHPQAATVLAALAEQGLIRLERRDSSDRPTWSLIGPVRELLARSQTSGSPWARDIRTRAAAHYAARAEYGPALRHLVAAGDRSGITQLLVAHGEILLAEGEANAVLSAADALDLAGASPRLLAVLSFARQLTGDWLGALALLRAAAGTEPLEAALALRLGQLYYVSGRAGDAVEAFERTRIGDAMTSDEIWLLCHAAIWLRAVGEDDRAREIAAHAAVAADLSADPRDMARCHWVLALIAAHDGDRAVHDVHHRRGLRLAGQLGDRMLQLGLRINHASYLAEEGMPEEVLDEAESALLSNQAAGVVGYEPLWYNIRARAKARLGQFTEAMADLELSQQRWQDIGPSFDVAFGLIVRGDIHRRRGEPGQAHAALAEALRAADSAEMRPMQTLALATLARARAADDLVSARELADRAVTLATGTGTVPALLARGWVALLAGARDEARQGAAAARSTAGARRDRAGLAEALELAVLAASDPNAAVGLLDEAATLWAEVGDPVGQARVQLIVARLAGPTGKPAADAAITVLRQLGLRVDSGVADALAVPVREPPIVVRTLGAFQVLRNGTPIPSAEWRSKKARDLFKILIGHQGRPAPRERLIDLLWPGDPPGRTANRLSVLLSTLRTVLDPERVIPEPGPILADRDTVALDLTLMAVDVETFLSLAATARTADRNADPAAFGLLLTAAGGYTGAYLPEDIYDGWAEPLRDTTRTTHVAVLRALLRHTADADQRHHHLVQLLEHDPYDEQAHQQLVRTLHDAGRHGEAHRRYRAYAARMTEIGVTPTPPQRAPRGDPPASPTKP
jgi:DNA-binding SARP family transcriptional activator